MITATGITFNQSGVDQNIMAELLGKVTRTKEWVVLCIFSQRTPFYGGHGIVGDKFL
jgi:hypothetical protein